MQLTREWIETFHANALTLFMECGYFVAHLQKADLSDESKSTLILREIRSLSSLCISIDPAAEGHELDAAMRFFRLAHIDRHTAAQPVEGLFASYHDLAWDISEDFLSRASC